jgi:type IV secretory pathway TrbD component
MLLVDMVAVTIGVGMADWLPGVDGIGDWLVGVSSWLITCDSD